jgi:hypothetical protein
MVNVCIPEFQKLWSNLIESLRLDYENTTQKCPEANAVMVFVLVELTAIELLVRNSSICISRSQFEMNSKAAKTWRTQEGYTSA